MIFRQTWLYQYLNTKSSVKFNRKILFLLTIQISIIFLSFQFISYEINKSTIPNPQPESYIPQGISQINYTPFSQIEQFQSMSFEKTKPSENLFLLFLSLNLISFMGITIGIMHFIKTDTSKKLQTEKLAIIGILAARINHDLRNPLSVIKNSTEILQIELEDDNNQKIKETLDRIIRSTSRMNHQIEDVLNFVRPTISKKTTCSLCIIIQDSIDRLIVPKDIVIKLPHNDCNILCDNLTLEIVFVNIITNAIQALNNVGQIEITIDDSKSDYVLVEIHDNGPGMDKETLNQIFDPLFTTKSYGTGLGLPSCKSIIESHGGTITVSSDLGLGTIFKIKIPK